MHQVRAIALYAYLDVAAFVGIDGRRLLAEAGISPLSLESPETRLPALPVVRLLERSAQLSGCDSFGIRLAQCRSFASLGPISLVLQHLANIGEVLETLGHMQRSMNDVVLVSVERTGDTISAKCDLVSPFRERQVADLAVGMLYLGLVGASRGRWAPEVVHFTHSVPKDRSTLESFFRAPLSFGSTFNGFSFHEGALGTPLPLADEAMAENARNLLSSSLSLPAMQALVTDQTKHTISLLLPTGNATLAHVARNLNKTARVLQRQLKAEGHSFADLLNEVRRDLAQRYVRASSQSITSISDALGYSTVGSFTRWFDREFGSAPSHWRKTQAEAAARPPPMWKV